MPTINLIEINTENNDYLLRLSDEPFIDGRICKIFEIKGNYQITNRDVTDKDLLYIDFIRTFFNFKYSFPEDYTFEKSIIHCCNVIMGQNFKYTNEYILQFKDILIDDEFERLFLEKLSWIINELYSNDKFYEKEFLEKYR